MRLPRLLNKVIVILVVAFGATLAAAAITTAWRMHVGRTMQYESKGMVIAKSIADASVEILLYRDISTIQAMIDHYLEIEGVAYVYVVNAREEIIAHTFVGVVPEEVQRAVGSKSEPTIREIRIDGRGEYLDISSPILAGSVGYVHVGMDQGLIQAAIWSAILQQLGLLGGIFLVGLVAALLSAERIVRPLNRLTEYANKLASGAFTDSQRAEPAADILAITARSDEAGQLAQAFRQMVLEVSAHHHELRLNEARLEALLHLNQMTDASLKEITDFALEAVVRLTGSKIGYLAFMNEDETVLTMHSWSHAAMAQCNITDKPIVYPVVNTGLWGEAVRQRKAVITNDYAAPNPWKKGYPAGHVAVLRHMNVPVSDGPRIVILAGVGNKDGPYGESDVRQLTLLMQGMWQLIQRRRAAETLAHYNEQLQAANRELEAFSYSVSHDLRTPLRSLDGFSLALIEDYGERLDDGAKGYLNRIRAASQRMGVLIDDLLKLSRLTRQEMNRQSVDLSRLARAVREELRGIEPDRDVEFVVQDGLVAQGDEHLLRVAVQQLLENAWKFTGQQPAARVEFGRTTLDHCDAFFVRDNGVGFDMTYADKLFGAFQRLHAADEFPGTGIGLATVHRIIHRHGGRIWAESAPGQGATFYFTL